MCLFVLVALILRRATPQDESNENENKTKTKAAYKALSQGNQDWRWKRWQSRWMKR